MIWIFSIFETLCSSNDIPYRKYNEIEFNTVRIVCIIACVVDFFFISSFRTGDLKLRDAFEIVNNTLLWILLLLLLWRWKMNTMVWIIHWIGPIGEFLADQFPRYPNPSNIFFIFFLGLNIWTARAHITDKLQRKELRKKKKKKTTNWKYTNSIGSLSHLHVQPSM